MKAKFLFLGMVATSMSLASCGTRNVHKTETEKTEQTKTESTVQETTKTDTNTKTDISTVVDWTDGSITETIEVKPIDTTKPAILEEGGKTTKIVNGSMKKVRKTKVVQGKKTQDHHVDFNEMVDDKKTNETKVASDTKTKESEKKTERDSDFPWWIVVLIGVIIVVGYLSTRKIED